jgi:hypothetical protein
MAKWLRLEKGHAPWQPAPDAELVRVEDEFNFPTLGIVHQDDGVFLFRCLYGHNEDESLWGYASLEGYTYAKGSGGYDDLVAVVLADVDVGSFALARTVGSTLEIIRTAEKVPLSRRGSVLSAAEDALRLSAEDLQTLGV